MKYIIIAVFAIALAGCAAPAQVETYHLAPPATATPQQDSDAAITLNNGDVVSDYESKLNAVINCPNCANGILSTWDANNPDQVCDFAHGTEVWAIADTMIAGESNTSFVGATTSGEYCLSVVLTMGIGRTGE